LQEELLSAWDTAGAAKYLEEKLDVRNPAGISLSQLAFRARLPEEVAHAFTEIPGDPALKAVRDRLGVGHLIALAKVDNLVEVGGKLSEDAAKVLVEMLQDEKTKTVNEQEFKAVVAYLYIKKATAGAQLEDSWRAAAAEATKLWNTLKAKNVIQHQGDEEFGVIGDLKTELKDVAPGDLAVEHCKAMHTAKIHEIKWKQSVAMHVSEFAEVVKKGSVIWWDYIKELPKLVLKSGMDADLQKILDERKALMQSDEALDAYSKTFLTFDTFITTAFKQMEADEQSKTDALKPIGIATDARRHVESAKLLLSASQQAIERLDAAHQWESRPIATRRVAFWLAMHKGKEGLNLAGEFLTNAAAAADPDAFIAQYMKGLSEADRAGLTAYLGRLNAAEELSGHDILAEVGNRGITVRGDALRALASQELAGGLGRWHIDDPAKVEPALRIALAGPGADALIKAFLTKTEQSYDFQGQKLTINAEDAMRFIVAIQNDLLFKARQGAATKEQLEKEELFTNPLEKVLRGSLDTLKELWDGDWADKAQAVAAIVAAIWLIRSMWKRGGLAKGVLIGLPLALVANTMYKKKTGKDFLGEALSYMSKEKRGTAVELFRRRAGRFDRYEVLRHNAGHAAMQQLLSADSSVSVEELLKWRESVKSKGSIDYSQGAPKGLSVHPILSKMGTDKYKPEDAYQVAYLVFEALCVDVAGLNNVGGDVDSMAERGANIIRRRYVEREQYSDEERAKFFKKGEKGERVTMLKVMIGESQTPASQEAIVEDRAFVEWLADSLGLSAAVVVSKLKQGWTVLQIKAEQIGEKMPEYWEAGKGFVLDGAESVSAWAQLTWRKLSKEVPKDFVASMNFVVETCKGIGVQVVTHGPEVVEFIAEKTTKLTAATAENVKALHDRILTQPELRMVLRPFEWFVYDSLGFEIAELSDEQAKEQINVAVEALATLLAGATGPYVMRDVSISRSISQRYSTERMRHFRFVDQTNTVLPVEALAGKASAKKIVMELVNHCAGKLWAGKNFDSLQPSQQRYVLELVQANIFEELQKDPKVARLAPQIASKISQCDADKTFLELIKEAEEAELAYKGAEQAAIDFQRQHPGWRNDPALSPKGVALANELSTKLRERQTKDGQVATALPRHTNLQDATR
ncbi:MAG: hypothetical protein PHO92_05345, partial [Candidatus Peribacteraceae bacterium]|nr:hypothetical protein [Candidatus Peribacteraceae bacterium]